MELLIVLAVVLAVLVVVSAPLRRSAAAEAAADVAAQAELADLEAAKEAKYREILDAELDHRTGKLSQEDFSSLDAELRGEAIELLRRIDAARARAGEVG